MKKKASFNKNFITIKCRILFLYLIIALLSKWEIHLESEVSASELLDQLYHLETIGFLKPWDDMDGLFAEYVEAVYKEYFAHQSRFTLHDLSKAGSILTKSKIPYKKIIHDQEILGQLVRRTHTESLLRTQIVKKGNQYLFTIDWLHSPFMDQIASINFAVDEPSDQNGLDSNFFADPLKENLNQLFRQVPFFGTVTGRDQLELTINLGADQSVSKGDIVVIGTLEEARKHPKLNTVMDWKIKHTGRAVIEQIEDNMAFCKIIEEEPGSSVLKLQKIIQIEKTPIMPTIIAAPEPADNSQERSHETQKKTNSMELLSTKPNLGWISASLSAGNSNWQFSYPVNSISNSGGGLTLNTQASAEIWVTREWFADLILGYSYFSFSQKNNLTQTLSAASQNGGVQGGAFSTQFNIGYSHLITSNMLGPKGWLKLGYKSDSYYLPSSNSEFTGPVGFGAIFLGLGGSTPVYEKWGVLLNFNYRIFSFVSQSWVGANANGSSDFQFLVGGTYQLNPRISIQGNFNFQFQNAEFTNGASLSQNIITFGPSLLYYF